MFNIANNGVIKINRGDTSEDFPLLINIGTRVDPVYYNFNASVYATNVPENLKIKIDKYIFQSKLPNDGKYIFIYKDKNWYLDNILINISSYGITVVGTPLNNDSFSIIQNNTNPSEVYVYIMDLYSLMDQWYIKKTFKSTGEVITEFWDEDLGTIYKEKDPITDKLGNILLNFDTEDTYCLEGKKYYYQVKVKLFEDNKYIYKTITDRLPFYVLDGIDATIWG